MTLIVEDGTGIVGADSYISISEMEKFCADYGHTWDTVENADAILRNASKYIDFRYSPYITGQKLNTEQGLSFPRKDMQYVQSLSDKEVFSLIKTACFELCVLLEQGTTLFTNTSNDPILIAESLANGAVSSKWDISNQSNLPKCSKVDAVLFPLFGDVSSTSLSGEGLNTIKLVRG